MFILSRTIELGRKLFGEEGLFGRIAPIFPILFFRFNELFGQQLCRQLFLCDSIRAIVLYIRALYFMEHKQMLRTFSVETGEIAPGTLKHNLSGLNAIERLEVLRRVSRIVHPVAALEYVSQDAKILVIGPRSEDDLLTLVGCGYRPENIRGLDIISYSPWVDLGDMHAMSYPDNSWDVVMAGWVIPYSKEPKKLVDEIIRVAKPGAVVAIGFQYVPLEQRLGQAAAIGWQGSQMNTVEELHSLFGSHRGDVFFCNDVSKYRPQEASNLITIFRLEK